MCFFVSVQKCQYSFKFLQKELVREKSGLWVIVQKDQDKPEYRIIYIAICHKQDEIWSWTFGCD